MTEQVTSPSEGGLRNPEDASAGADVVVLGIGNFLMGDDGAGIHVIDRLRSDAALPSSVLLVDGGTLGFSLMEQVESARVLIVVDAMQLDAEPGTVKSFLDGELDNFLAAPTQRSVHDANLGDVMRMCALRDTLPENRILVGIQPASIDWGDTPTAAVDRGVDAACACIKSIIEEYAP